MCNIAGQGGHLACLQFLHENGCELPPNLCSVATAAGSLECLRYVPPSLPLSLFHSLLPLFFHSQKLRYAYEKGCRVDASTLDVAAERGSLECMKYLRDKQCQWTSLTCDKAAKGGNVDCLRYSLLMPYLLSQYSLFLSLDLLLFQVCAREWMSLGVSYMQSCSCRRTFGMP